MIARLSPLCNDNLIGRALVPVCIAAGSDLFHHFDLDTARLEEIVNNGVSKTQEVELDDLKLIAKAGIEQTCAKLRLSMTPGPVNERPANMEDPLRGEPPGPRWRICG